MGINIFNQGWQGLFTSAQAFFRLRPITYSFYLRGMGAGDVKLLAVIGALKGPYFVFTPLLLWGWLEDY